VEQSNATEAVVQPQKTSGLSFTGLAQIFYAPTAFYEKLKNEPKILVPYLVYFILIVISMFMISELLVQHQISSPQLQERLPGQPITPELRQILYWQNIIGGSLIMALAPLLAAAMATFWGNFVFAGKSKFKSILSVVLYGEVIYAAGAIIGALMMLAKKSIMASLSLGILVADRGANSVAYVALSKIDLFIIWEIIVVGIGLSIIFGFSRNRGYVLSVLSVGMLSIIHIALTAIGSLF